MQTQICKFNVRDTVKQRQKGEKNGRSISDWYLSEMYLKSADIEETAITEKTRTDL